MIKEMLGVLALVYASHSYGIECIELKKDNTLEFEMKKSENYDNCFAIAELPENTPFQIILFSPDNVRSKTTLYDLNTYGTASYISDYLSNANGASLIQSNTTNRKIGFKITPTSFTSSNKDMHLTYMSGPEGALILAHIYDIPSSNVTPPPPRPPIPPR